MSKKSGIERYFYCCVIVVFDKKNFLVMVDYGIDDWK